MIKDATYLANLIRNKEISPVEALDDMFKKAQNHKNLNAFVELDIDKAKAELKKRKQVNVEKLPFYGVPYPLKDVGQSKEGYAQTFGSKLFKENKAIKSNEYTRKIEEAGFIPFGVTTSPEFAFKNVTDAEIYGATLNPHDLERFSGGSSGGAASVVASGISPIAGASDGGGSIRIPASFTSLIGLKPSRGMIITGPDDYRSWQGASVNFALTVSIRDTQKMLNVLKPENQYSPYNRPNAMLPVVNRPLKIALCFTSPIGNQVSEDAIEAVLEAANFFENLGHEVSMIDYPVNGNDLIRSYYMMNGGETAAMFEDMARGFGREMTRDDMELMTWTIYQYGKRLSASEYSKTFTNWDQAGVTMEKLFETYDLFLSPTATTIAPKLSDDLQSDTIRSQMAQAENLSKQELQELVYQMFEKSLWLTPYTQLANLTGQPAISLPTYLTKKEQMPIGIQLMASRGHDRLLLEVGQWLEDLKKLMIPNIYKVF